MGGLRPAQPGRAAGASVGRRGLLRLGLTLLAAGLVGCAHSRARSWRGTVTQVLDGDTVLVRAVGEPGAVAVRILGIDAPEICQAWGPQAQQALAQRVLHQEVDLEGAGQDSYGRELARLHWQGRDMGRWLVVQGHAWSYRHGRDGGPYAAEEREARAARRGLFAQGRPELPRSFRHRHGACRPG